MTRFLSLTSDYIKDHISEFTNKKTVIITGAGISVSSGIPDFRSKNGIFNSIKEKLKIKGQDLFNYRYSRDKETRPTYYKFMANLKTLTDEAKPSKTHQFLPEYKKLQKKMRVYSQNIDSLEEKAGLKYSEKENSELIYLHGNLKYLICVYCGYKIEYTKEENETFEAGEDIACVKCTEENVKRKNSKLREVNIGYMHTGIIHYDQPHHDAYKIGKIFEKDMDLDLFIVIGTSLKVYGVKDLVKRGLRNCILNNGKSIFVNLEEPNKEFKNMFDYFWKGDCDKFCEAMKNGIDMMKIDTKLEKLRIKKGFLRDKEVKGDNDKMGVDKKKNDELNKESLRSTEIDVTVKMDLTKKESACGIKVDNSEKKNDLAKKGSPRNVDVSISKDKEVLAKAKKDVKLESIKISVREEVSVIDNSVQNGKISDDVVHESSKKKDLYQDRGGQCKIAIDKGRKKAIDLGKEIRKDLLMDVALNNTKVQNKKEFLKVNIKDLVEANTRINDKTTDKKKEVGVDNKDLGLAEKKFSVNKTSNKDALDTEILPNVILGDKLGEEKRVSFIEASDSKKETKLVPKKKANKKKGKK